MRLYEYESYSQYQSVQSAKNTRQIDVVWATEREMDIIAKYVAAHLPDAKFGIVHGAKAGWECNALQQRLGFPFIGTDISPTALQFPNMIQWDFHHVKDEWLGQVDVISTNCLDHSYAPELALDSWMSCLQPKGLCLIEWSEYHGEEHSTLDDPFGASQREYEELFSRKYRILDRLSVPADPSHAYPLDRTIFVVGHKPA